MTPVKKACLSRDISIETIKKCGKKNNMTINDVIMTVISMSLKEYFKSKGDAKTDQITMAVPFSLRKAPTDPKDFTFDN